MRKIVVSEFVSLDGIIEHPAWTMPFIGDEQNAFKFAELKAADSLLLGRVTYEGFAAAWPGMAAETGEYGEMMNGYPKYVASTTLDSLEWNATLLGEDIAAELTALKQRPGRDILVFGSGKFLETLLRHDLVDEYRLMIYPIVVGKGQRLFGDGIDTTTLKLTDTKTFSTGVVVLTYEPARNA
ncbi:MAG TPA: dihydrofolate reductase family protein [Thermomicrobiales bacterium]